MLNIKSGQTVWVNYGKTESTLEEKVIDKVGKKYFTLVGDWRGKYYIETGYFVTEYSTVRKVYIDKQEYLDRLERERVVTVIRRGIVNDYQMSEYALSDLRTIAQIIESTKNK